MIVAAAIRIDKLICSLPRPYRHHDILRGINGLYEDRNRYRGTFESETQGFIDHDGNFLNRTEAYDHCIECGQILVRRNAILKSDPNCYNGIELFSEDLW